MYTQSFSVSDGNAKDTHKGPKPVPVISAEDAAKIAAFEQKIADDGRIEPQDWMPEAYRKTLVR
ncbi:MAG: 1,2-phenylacetyl-CoA epoxidase subunit A, partial [Burkholderiaceae bacterium]